MAKLPGLTIEDLRRAVAERRLAPVYLVLGSDAAVRRRAFEALRAAFVDADGAEAPGAIVRLEIEKVLGGGEDGASDGLAAILNEAHSLPLFAMAAAGPSRMLWVGDGEKLEGIADLESLRRYLASPITDACLVFEAAGMDKRKAAYKMLAAAAGVVDCDPPSNAADVRRWIAATLALRGYTIEPQAAVLLLDMAGTGITALEQELEKAMLFVGESGTTIRAQDLEGLVGRTRGRTVFDLTDALVAGDPVAATRHLNMLVDDGEEPLRLLAMIAWVTRQLVIAHDLGARLPERDALEALGGRWEQRKSLLERARRGNRKALLAALEACGSADQTVKRLRDPRLGADRLRPARGALEALCREICAA